jgi:hypothetical protein
MAATPYDLVVIGGGPGGYVAAIRGAQLGGRVAVVEMDRLGGTCLNRGCIPTKTMIHDADLYRQVASGQFAVGGPVQLDFGRLMARKREVVEAVVGGVERLMTLHHIDVYAGRAQVVSPREVRVTMNGAQETLTCRAMVVATGSVPARVPLPGADLPGVVTSDGLMDLDHLPRSVVVLGASAIGLEYRLHVRIAGVRRDGVGPPHFPPRRRGATDAAFPHLALAAWGDGGRGPGIPGDRGGRQRPAVCAISAAAKTRSPKARSCCWPPGVGPTPATWGWRRWASR